MVLSGPASLRTPRRPPDDRRALWHSPPPTKGTRGKTPTPKSQIANKTQIPNSEDRNARAARRVGSEFGTWNLEFPPASGGGPWNLRLASASSVLPTKSAPDAGRGSPRLQYLYTNGRPRAKVPQTESAAAQHLVGDAVEVRPTHKCEQVFRLGGGWPIVYDASSVEPLRSWEKSYENLVDGAGFDSTAVRLCT